MSIEMFIRGEEFEENLITLTELYERVQIDEIKNPMYLVYPEYFPKKHQPEIVQLIINSYTTKQVSQILGISTKTVDGYISGEGGIYKILQSLTGNYPGERGSALLLMWKAGIIDLNPPAE